MKIFNLLFGIIFLLFGFFGIAFRKKFYAQIHASDKVPLMNLEKKILRSSEHKIEKYGYVKYLLAQLFIILIGFMAIASSFS